MRSAAGNAAAAGTWTVGLDIGGTKTHGVVLDEDGSILAQVRKSTRPGADGVVDTAERVFEALGKETGGRLTCPVGVGFTSRGPMGALGFTITTGAPVAASSRATTSARHFESL